MKGGDCYEELSLDPLPKTLSMEKKELKYAEAKLYFRI
jgi:hypothetical protein